MPVTIQPTTLKYKDENGVFHAADCLQGDTPDFSIGTVSTLTPGQSATASITGTPAAPVLNLGIPQGSPGNPTQLIDDTAGIGDTDVTWSANKIATVANGKVSTVNEVAPDANGNVEVTTTVQDGAITRAKLNADLQAKTDAVPGLMSAINSTATEETGQALLTEEERETIILIAALDNIDYLIAHLPQDSSLMDIVEELQTENAWLDMIYNEMVIKEAASA